MRVGFVTQWYPPEPGTHLPQSIASGLAGRGHEVHVLTGFPNYPTGRLRPDYPLRPYRREQSVDGVTVHRAPLYPSHDSAPVQRAFNYGTFAVSSSAVARLKMPVPDVWLTYSSPATSALAPMTYRFRHRRPSCLIIQDLWPDSVTDSGMVPARLADIMRPPIDRFCRLAYRNAAAVGVISPSMRQILESRGVPAAKIFDTPNWSTDDLLRPDLPSSTALRRELGLPAGRLFMYVGNLGRMQALDSLVRGFSRAERAQLVLIGDGVSRSSLVDLVRDEGADNVHVLGPRPATDIGKYIAASDVQIISLMDTPLLRATMPSKMQFSLASARPLLAHAAGDVAELVSSEGVGLGVQPGDSAALALAVQEFSAMTPDQLQRIGCRSRTLYESRFSQRAGLDRLERMLLHAIRSSPAGQAHPADFAARRQT
ncbi:glycosyltransferase family 4 protein [Leekyejoonella antrihumi]|uniref:D-inositol 3-phosphate glycosyltransferase n=1 Tax=Leekyejoonella antrihumi TaxID=1660198 RepID=A0A563E116_9MICO|nr:glycosyltransferase family 4 protein [Leekyejoonella antrihumi]TWP35901.1 glycosyltransferase family 4 protein [Leekyejoonella antrihumi]